MTLKIKYANFKSIIDKGLEMELANFDYCFILGKFKNKFQSITIPLHELESIEIKIDSEDEYKRIQKNFTEVIKQI